MKKEDIEKLADMARVDLQEEEIEAFAEDVSGILSYVQKIQDADVSMDDVVYAQKNVLREDENMHAGGRDTETLLGEAPSTKDGFIEVQKIL